MITDLKELEKFLKLCRKHGITEITFEDVSVKFGDMPTKSESSFNEESPVDSLTPEQLMFLAVENVG